MPPLIEKNRKWWILLAMTIVNSMIFIDITVLPVALPTIQRLLGLSEIGLQWILNAYTLSLTIFLLLGGRLGDRFGHKKILYYGLFLFTLGSIFCALTESQIWLILSRAILGMGGALLIPASASILFHAFVPEQRGKALGFYVSMGSVFLSLGPFIGGFFTEYFSWRLVFWINLPIGISGAALTYFFVHPIKGQKGLSFDWLGFLTSSLGICLIIIGLMQAKEWGWASPLTIGFFLLGLFLLVILWAIDRKIEDPFFDFSLFRNRMFLTGNIATFCAQFLLTITVFWAMYFQNVFHFTPTQAGLLNLIASAPLLIVAPLGGHLVDRHGPKIPILIGFFLLTLSLFWFLQNLDNSHLLILLSVLIPFGCAIPLIFTPSFTAAMQHIPKEKRGLASGTASMIRQFSSTLGLAIIGTVFLHVHSFQFQNLLKSGTQTRHIDPKLFDGLLAKSPRAMKQLLSYSASTKEWIEHTYLYAYVDAFSKINSLALILAFIGLIFTMLFIQKNTAFKGRKK